MKRWSIYIILAASPFILLALLLLEPTSDDWTYLTDPHFGDPFLPERILPNGNYWRPFDALYGSLISRFVWLYPAMNHIIILLAHCINSFIIFKLTEQMFSDKFASNISTIYFFISPAVAATLFGIDSINQAMSQMFGLMSVYVYLYVQKIKIPLWTILVFISILCKENGMSWAIISPFLSLGLNSNKKKNTLIHLLIGFIIIGIYMLLRFSLSNNAVNGDSVYFDFSIVKKIKDFGVFVCMTLTAIDFVSLAHAPSRNIIFLTFSIILSVPFMIFVFIGINKNYKDRLFISLFICIIIAAGLHLLTLFGAMHAYSSLGMSALLLSYFIYKCDCRKIITVSFIAYSISAIAVDYRHYIKSYESGMTGYNMGKSIIEKCRKPYEKVYIINIDDHYPSYSSFCMSPFDAFGWGNAAIKYNKYRWPKELCDTVIENNDKKIIDEIAMKAIEEGWDCVWLCNKENVDIVMEKVY